MNRFRRLARRLAYDSGMLGIARAGCRDVLTVVMMHRIIDRADPDFAAADPAYTLAADLFDELLGFFGEHYTVVGLPSVLAAAERRRPLPAYPLLITFDDGWADNLRFAAPRLRRHGFPAVVFAAVEPILSPAARWWQDDVCTVARSGGLAALRAQIAPAGPPARAGNDDEDLLHTLVQFAGIAEADRAAILHPAGAPELASRMMLAPADLPQLAAAGIAVASHGYRHLPLTAVDDPAAEIRRASAALAGLTGDPVSAAVLSLPHGRYDGNVIAAARTAGVRLVFSSDPVLNPAPAGFVAADRPIGRIALSTRALTDPSSGRQDHAAAATWLWRRPVANAERSAA